MMFNRSLNISCLCYLDCFRRAKYRYPADRMAEKDAEREEYLNIEFDVNMTCDSCVHAITEALKNQKGIKSFDIDFPKQSVVIKTNLPSQEVQDALESTGRKVVLKGFGSDKAAVAEINSTCSVLGVVRFHQINNDTCIIDGTIDGLKEGEHGLHIHEYGDLSDGFNKIGNCFSPPGLNLEDTVNQERHYGNLGNIYSDGSGRANFRKTDCVVKVWDIIGRSLIITSERDNLVCAHSETPNDIENVLACAIIARFAGIFQNPKRLCQCDGISIWDENVQPSSSERQHEAKL